MSLMKMCNSTSIDIISIEKTGENFRLIFDVKGRFAVHRITTEEAKVCMDVLQVTCITVGSNAVANKILK